MSQTVSQLGLAPSSASKSSQTTPSIASSKSQATVERKAPSLSKQHHVQAKPVTHNVANWFDQVVLGLASSVDVHADLVKGLHSKSARAFLNSFVEIPKPLLLTTLGISQRTLDRAIEQESMLNLEATDRATQLAETRAKAAIIFGDSKAAERWLLQPLPWLAGNRPIELLQTSTGTEMVKEYLERIDRGVYA